MAVLEGQTLTHGKVISIWTCNIPVSPQIWIRTCQSFSTDTDSFQKFLFTARGCLFSEVFIHYMIFFYIRGTQIHFLNQNKSYSLWNNIIYDITNSLHINSLVGLT